jgi:xylulokinase
MGAALGIGADLGEVVVSLGTSGTAYGVSDRPTADPTGLVAGFADAAGRFLPLACMLNCTRVLDAMASMVGLTTLEALDLAAETDPGAGGLLLLPYLGGERTPNLPESRGAMVGLSYENATPASIVRATVDGVAAGLAYSLGALAAVGLTAPRIVLVGGGSRHPAWRQAIADATGRPVEVRGGEEHVARGAAVQAAAIVRGEPVDALARRWRPEAVGESMPRAGAREAFRLGERQELIAAQRRNQA